MANVYVDGSATNDGDGTSPAQAGSPGGVGAFKTMVGHTPTTGDTWWFRRTSTAIPLAANFTFANVNTVNYIGWPISTDLDYSRRPAAGQSGGAANWDADSTSTIQSITSNSTQTITISLASSQVFRRLNFDTGTGGTTISGTSPEFRYGTITSSLTSTTASLIINATTVGTGPTFYNATIDNKSTGRSLTTANISWPQFYDCTISHTVSGVTTSAVSITAGLFVRTTFSDTISTSAASPWLTNSFNSTGQPVMMYDCTFNITNTTSGAVGIQCSTNNFSWYVRNTSYSGPSMVLTALDTWYDIHFSKFTQTAANTAGGWQISDVNNNVGCKIAASNVAFITGNTAGDIVLTSGTGPLNCQIYLNNCVFANASSPVVGNPTPGIFSNDHNGTLGAWKFYGPRGTIQTTNANRTGGEAFSLQFAQADATNPFWVPTDMAIPGLDTYFISLASGANTVTLYGAYKTSLYTVAPTQEDIWFEVEYLDNASTAHRTTASSKTGGATALTSDSSTWNNDTGLTVFKIVLSITAGQACKCPTRIRFNKLQSGSAYTLVDPIVVVT